MNRELLLNAIHLAKKGEWDRAHSIVQDLDSREAAMIHACLHRVEGDEFNAGYWYNRAKTDFFRGTFEQELDYLEKVIALE